MTRTELVLGAGGFAIALVFGAIAANALPASLPHLPASALLAVLILTSVIPILLVRWRRALAVFLGWLVVEDLVRKLAGNNLAVYFVKDFFFALVLMSLLVDPEARGTWRAATGRARFLLYALMAWAVAMSVPTGLQDWRLPLVGLRLNFLYVPLVLAGYLLAQDAPVLRHWLVGIAMLGAGASLVGIAQAYVGPGFLSPSVATPALNLLATRRATFGKFYSNPTSFIQPSGTFVSSGRFGAMVLVTLVIALAVVVSMRGRKRWIGLGSVLLAAAAVWVAGGRAGLLLGAILLLVAALAPLFGERRAVMGRAMLVAGAAALVLIVAVTLEPNVFGARLVYYRETLDPRSPVNQWQGRFSSAADSTAQGLRDGGILGGGTGLQSLGKQYLYDPLQPSQLSTYQVEGGYASVAVEWGLIGLALWIAWTIVWARRQWRAIKLARGGPFAAAGLVIFVWMFFFLFVGFFGGNQAFQDYVGNAYFWLLSGVLFGLPQGALSSSKLAPRPIRRIERHVPVPV